MSDLGLTHIALQVSSVDDSARFYAKYASMKVVHGRTDADTGKKVVWLSDLTRPFAIVLIETDKITTVLRPFSHLGIGCASREDVDRLAAEAAAEGILVGGPTDSAYPVGYWAFLQDPDGHTLEISHGQEVGLTIKGAHTTA